MPEYNRRTLVRGAAWSIPVVAVAVHAPAFAASTDPPKPGTYSACKGPGANNCQGYRITINFTVDAPYAWTIDFTSIKINGAELLGATTPTQFTLVSNGNSTRTFFVCTGVNSASFFDLDIAYTASRPGVPGILVDPLSFKLTGVRPNC